MNKKFTVDNEGNVTVLTDKWDVVGKGIYTNSTRDILAIENVIEELTKDICDYEETKKGLKNANMKNKKTLFILLAALVVGVLSGVWPITVLGCVLTLVCSLEIVQVNKIIEECQQNIINNEEEIAKYKSELEELKKDNVPAEFISCYNYADVLPVFCFKDGMRFSKMVNNFESVEEKKTPKIRRLVKGNERNER